ncbi:MULTISPECIES: M91 family zinc metallopeptidase [Pseudomonas]|uniref:Hemolysin n=1 Tax=Pseudomonas fluorescens LMG 5329 TaxID=1324332 RepID=A0A0A1YWS9_PSEFL|nr:MULTISPECIES: M91 family zinc metallopeptidase [Pseudomonas]KGE65444.1 hemolysin [Pseudomonas fluorescens LMG 5329]NWE05437.1 hemolysin [Pseudomonas sp. IPO3749]NWF19119.1 hemolysin [Pseudomonas sp. IPO3749]
MEVSKSLENAHRPPLKGEHHSTHAPVVSVENSRYVPAVAPQLPFTPDNQIQAYVHPVLDDGNLKVSCQSVWEQDVTYSLQNSLVLETGDKADQIHVSQTRAGQLDVRVNGRLYRFDSEDKDGKPLTFHFKTHGGDDNIHIDANVTQPVIVEAGDGNDRVRAGGGYTRVFGGKGDDVLRLGSGLGYAEGNDGDDTIMGGTGDNIIYGNNGNDRLYAGAGPKHKTSYLDGGNGNDRLYAGNGHTVLHGGAGDDRLIGHDRTTFYTGDGRDTVIANGPGDLIYGKPDDAISHLNGSRFTAVSAAPEPQTGFVIKGSPEFIQRVEDDLALLRRSPIGQQMLAAMSAMAQRNGAPVTIVEDLVDLGSGYVYGSQELKALFGYERAPIVGDDPKWGFMVDGVPGSQADRAEISYNRSAVDTVAGVTYASITTLYHEMVHAYNAGNGTALTGSTTETFEGEQHDVPNSERQAVGLPTTPATPPNPKPLTENALNEEMGKPLRPQYVG